MHIQTTLFLVLPQHLAWDQQESPPIACLLDGGGARTPLSQAF